MVKRIRESWYHQQRVHGWDAPTAHALNPGSSAVRPRMTTSRRRGHREVVILGRTALLPNAHNCADLAVRDRPIRHVEFAIGVTFETRRGVLRSSRWGHYRCG